MSPEVNGAMNTLNRLIPLVEDAERQFKGARNWGFLDLLGGETLTDIIKHYKLHKAKNIMDEVDYLLHQLSQQLGGIDMPAEYRMELGGFSTFADFLFDGVLADAYMFSKIMSSLDQVQKLKFKLYTLKDKLQHL